MELILTDAAIIVLAHTCNYYGFGVSAMIERCMAYASFSRIYCTGQVY